MKKIYLLLLLCIVHLGAFATQYFPQSASAPTGSTYSYCVGDPSVSYSVVVTMCPTSSGTAIQTNTITPTWYMNGVAIFTGASYVPSSTATYTVTIPASVVPTTSAGIYSGANGLQVRLSSSATPVAGGCTVSPAVGSSATITVYAVPGPITGYTSSFLCIGSTVTLSNSVTGGTWSSLVSSVASVGLTTGVVTGVAAGGTIITYSNGGCTATLPINVTTNPTPITPPTVAICEGAVATLTDGTPGGTWSSSVLGTATINSSGVVTAGPAGTAAGTTTITYQLPTGCYALRTVTVNPIPPAITGAAAVCQFSNTTLTNSLGGGTWSASPTSIASVNSTTGVVTGVAPGTASISYTVATCYTVTAITVGAPVGPITGSSVVCSGGSVTTLSNTTAGGTWSTAPVTVATVSPTGVVTGISSGTVTVSYSTPGCNAATKILSVNPQPLPIGGAAAICIGQSSTLYEATPGGIWTVGDTTVIHFDTLGVISGSTDALVTGLAVGTSSITYTMMPAGCHVNVVITVNPLAPIGGPDSLCAGGTGYMTNIVGGGTWTSGSTSVATIGVTNGVLNALVPGPTFIVYTTPVGCITSKLVKVIAALPPISGPSQVCSGSTITLGNGSPHGAWSTSNAFVGAIVDSSGVLTGGYPDTVDITYSKPAPGCSVSTVITVNPLPVPTITYSGPVLHKLTTNVFYVSYQWYDSTSGILTGATTYQQVIPNLDEFYYVVVSDINGCVGHSGYLYHSTLDVSNVSGGGVEVYPNPASDMLYIKSAVPVNAVVTDIAGRQEIVQQRAERIDVSNLVNGVYLISMYDESGKLLQVQKLLKQ
jgi:hypothetical protein